ncbi:hypothetical protein TNCV_2481081, partial [Trichonephila clavipes]
MARKYSVRAGSRSDIANQMARKYSVKAGSRRWPVYVFYNILDLAENNSWILYQEVT